MMGMKKAVIFLILLFGLSGVAQAAFKTKLSDIHVQSALQNYFPLKEYSAIARVTLQEPKVQLEAGNKDIVLMIPVDANITGDAMHRGHITVLVDLSYKASSGGLYLHNPRLGQFEMPSVEKKMVGELREFVTTIIKNALPLVRIYKLKERDINHSLAKSALKNVRFEDGRINLEFGFQ